MMSLDLLILGLLKAGANAIMAEYALMIGGSIKGLIVFMKFAIWGGLGSTILNEFVKIRRGDYENNKKVVNAKNH